LIARLIPAIVVLTALRKLDALEQKYDTRFNVVFQAIRELMMPPRRRRAIGFRVEPGA
jgi:hypothetical protein